MTITAIYHARGDGDAFYIQAPLLTSSRKWFCLKPRPSVDAQMHKMQERRDYDPKLRHPE